MDILTILEQQRLSAFSGSILVRHGANTLVDAGWGMADREKATPNTPATAFQIASISKQFTASAILLLQERGLLSVRDPLSRWLPEEPDSWRSIEIHHLLAHMSGLGHWAVVNPDYTELSLFHPRPREDVLGIFATYPLKFPPGSAWAYSSPGFVLLAEIAERASGIPYGRFLRDEIFVPLEMHSTGAGNRAPFPEMEAVGYAGDQRSLSFELDTVGMGAGDVWSTTGDLARWDMSLRSGGVLSPQSIGLMTAYHAETTEDVPWAGYGYGTFVASRHGHRMLFHPGHNAGFRAINIFLPEDEMTVVLLSNSEDVDLLDVSGRIVDGVLGDAD